MKTIKLELLKQWEAAFKQNEAATAPLREMLGENPHHVAFYKALWDTFDRVTTLTEKLLGVDDDILRWYELECGMGETPKEIDGTLVDSVDVLVNFL